MKKNEFFNELRKKLKILKKEEVEDIIREYEDNINEKIKNGYSEEDAIKSFGNIDELCNEILDAYKISYENTNSFEDVVSNYVSKISNWLKDIISNFSNHTAEEILNIIFKGIYSSNFIFIISCIFLYLLMPSIKLCMFYYWQLSCLSWLSKYKFPITLSNLFSINNP